jgi:hypothetical protein
VSGKVFANVMMAYTTPELIREVGHFGAELVRAFMVIGIGPGLAGIVVAWRRSRALGGLLVLVFVISAGFYINYRVVDKDTMFLPAYLIWALWVGLGYQWLIDWAGQPSAAAHPQAAAAPVLALKVIMAGAVVFALAWNWPLTDLSDDWSARVREKILELARPSACSSAGGDGAGRGVPAARRGIAGRPGDQPLPDPAPDSSARRARSRPRPVYLDEPLEGCLLGSGNPDRAAVPALLDMGSHPRDPAV